MKRRLALLCCALCLSWLVAAPASAEARSNKADAEALVHKVVAYYKAHGRDRTLAAINAHSEDVSDAKHQLFVYVSDISTGRSVAHGSRHEMVGLDFSNIRDTTGKPFVAQLMLLARFGESGWVDHTRPNPATKQIEARSTYVQAFDGLAFCTAVSR